MKNFTHLKCSFSSISFRISYFLEANFSISVDVGLRRPYCFSMASATLIIAVFIALLFVLVLGIKFNLFPTVRKKQHYKQKTNTCKKK